MIWNIDKYRFTTVKKKKNRPVLFVIIFVLIAVTITGWALRIDKRIHIFNRLSKNSATLLELWDDQLYDKVIDRCNAILKKDPMDSKALIFRGFSYFYKAAPEISVEKKIPLLTKSINSLRLAKLTNLDTIKGEVDYILGKAYFLKGRYYYDLSIRYILLSIKEGYSSNDAFQFLGLAYTQLGNPEKGIEYFNLALKEKTSDILLLAAAKNYFTLKKYNTATEYLERAINSTKDTVVEEKSRFLLGDIYTKQNKLLKAEEEYSKIAKLNPKSADAHYYLGEIYRMMNKPVKARAEWREALIIDPSHYAAKLRYYK